MVARDSSAGSLAAAAAGPGAMGDIGSMWSEGDDSPQGSSFEGKARARGGRGGGGGGRGGGRRGKEHAFRAKAETESVSRSPLLLPFPSVRLDELRQLFHPRMITHCCSLL